MTELPSADKVASTLTIKNVRLPPEAYASLDNVALPHDKQDELPLVDLQYVHFESYSQGSTVEVHVSTSTTTSSSPTVELALSHPFESVAQDVPCPAAGSASATQLVSRFTSATPTNRTSHCIDARGSLSLPGGLCHPHIHLDKCFLLDRCPLSTGTFDEALSSTSDAKANFTPDDVIARMRRLVAASISHGVTCMRAFAEVDPTVGLMCLEAAIQVKREYAAKCEVQIVAFAQDAVFYPDDDGKEQQMQGLMQQAASNEAVDVVGSAPYVEAISKHDQQTLTERDKKRKQKEQQQRNIRFTFDLARQHGKHVDFHLDYDLDPPASEQDGQQSMIPFVVTVTQQQLWSHTNGNRRSVTMGHCTKLSVFSSDDLEHLSSLFTDSDAPPISFVALPPSDLYMQGRAQPYASRSRATLPLLTLSTHPTLRAHTNWAMGVNNVGNLFTPQGDADPLAMLPMMVGVWQSARRQDCEVLMGAVSSRARVAAGFEGGYDNATSNVWADLAVIDGTTSVQDAVCAPSYSRITIKHGRLVARRKVDSNVYPHS